MKRIYNFNYDSYNAEVSFEVDLDKFTPQMANDTLQFFTWRYDEEADPIDEVMKKYAMISIKVATAENLSKAGVINEFKDNEGFYPIDGSCGITLRHIITYEFDEYLLEVQIIPDET